MTTKRGYIRKSIRCSEQKQREALEQAGVTTIYSETTKNGDGFVRSLRPNDSACVYSLARLGANRRQLRYMVDAIHKKKAVIVEVVTGRRSDKPSDLTAMFFDAVDELAGDKRVHSPKAAKKYGSMGGRPRTEKLDAKLAEREWFDSRNKSIYDALDKMEGYSMRQAYREFGPRGVKVGRPRKKR